MSFIIIIFIFTHLGFQAGSTEGKHGHHSPSYLTM